MPQIPVKDTVKGLALAEPEVVELETDILMVGAGMGNCGTAFEACRWADKAGVKVLLVEGSSNVGGMFQLCYIFPNKGSGY